MSCFDDETSVQFYQRMVAAGWTPPEKQPECEELMKLRLGIARVAQALNIDPYLHVPGHPVNWRLEALTEATRTERGWNALLAHIVDTIQRREQGWHSMVERLKRILNEEEFTE